MTPERWQQIETIFHEVRELPKDARGGFLAAACAGDAALRDEVESLLRQQGELIDGGAMAAAAALAPGGGRLNLAGRTLGPYVLGDLLGAGGMGEVYRARDRKLARDVAVKILPRAFVDHPDRLARFEREARTLASLNHPHIGAIYGFEEEGDLRGLILELVDGDTLSERLVRGPLTIPDVIALARQIADALDAAHAKGIVHRDLKPANIKITPAGMVKVLDFGLAKAIDDADDSVPPTMATREGTVMGTAPYMSPEQARGRVVDKRTDIWAFGCVLYEMLTGRQAFQGDSRVDVLAAVVNSDPDLAALPAATPPALRAVIARCLEKDLQRRARDIGDIRHQLEGPVLSPPPPRSRWLVPAAAAGVVLLAIAVWAGIQYGRKAPAVRPDVASAPDVATFAALKAEQFTTARGFDGFARFSADGRNVAYSSDRTGTMEIYVQALAAGSTPIQLTNNGRQNIEPAWSPDGQFIAFHEMAGNGIWMVPSHGGAARKLSDFGSFPAWSPDGRRVAFQSFPPTALNSLGTTSPLCTIWMVGVDHDDRPVAVTKSGEPPGAQTAPLWSADGRRIVFANSGASPAGGRDSVQLWDVNPDGGRPRRVGAQPTLSTVFSIDLIGHGLYFIAAGARTVWWLPFSETGELVGDPKPTGLALTGSDSSHFAISPDGRHVSWTATDSTSNIWALPADKSATPRGEPVALTDGTNVRYGLPKPSADGRMAIAASRPGSPINTFLLEPGQQPRLMVPENTSHGGAAWMPGGKEISVLANHGKGGGYYALDPATGRERELFPLSAIPKPEGSSAYPAPPSVINAFSPDYTQLAVTLMKDGVPNLWLVSLGKSGPDGRIVQRTFDKEGGGFPVWSPDGRWIGYQCNAGSDTYLCATSATDGGRIDLVREPGQSWVGGWMPDNDTLLFAAFRAAVWNVAHVSRTTGAVSVLTKFTYPRMYVRYPRWDAAHSRIVFERSETTGRIWTAEIPAAAARP